MRIALVFSGAPRIYESGAERIKQNLMYGYDVDVFSYTWKISDWSKVPDLYTYKDLVLLEPTLYEKCPKTSNHLYEQYMCLQLAAKSFCTHVENNNLKYDYVVRARHDVWPYHKVHYYRFNQDYYYVSRAAWGYNGLSLDDNFALMSYNTYKKIYSEIYDSLLHTKDPPAVSEFYLATHLAKLDLLWEVRHDSTLNFCLTRAIYNHPEQYKSYDTNFVR
jgi:hypothetical protein